MEQIKSTFFDYFSDQDNEKVPDSFTYINECVIKQYSENSLTNSSLNESTQRLSHQSMNRSSEHKIRDINFHFDHSIFRDLMLEIKRANESSEDYITITQIPSSNRAGLHVRRQSSSQLEPILESSKVSPTIKSSKMNRSISDSSSILFTRHSDSAEHSQTQNLCTASSHSDGAQHSQTQNLCTASSHSHGAQHSQRQNSCSASFHSTSTGAVSKVGRNALSSMRESINRQPHNPYSRNITRYNSQRLFKLLLNIRRSINEVHRQQAALTSDLMSKLSKGANPKERELPALSNRSLNDNREEHQSLFDLKLSKISENKDFLILLRDRALQNTDGRFGCASGLQNEGCEWKSDPGNSVSPNDTVLQNENDRTSSNF